MLIDLINNLTGIGTDHTTEQIIYWYQYPSLIGDMTEETLQKRFIKRT